MDLKLIADLASASATVVIALTGICALIYAARQLHQARESEKVKHLVEFVQDFERQPMADYRRKVVEQRLKGIEYSSEAQKILDFFEMIGLLVRRGYLDAHDVWNTFSYWIFNVFTDFRNDIEQIRRDDETYYEDFCKLLEILRHIEKEEGCSNDCLSKDEILDFWRGEAKTLIGSPITRKMPTSTGASSHTGGMTEK